MTDRELDVLHLVAEGFFAGRFNRHGARLMLPGWIACFVPTLDFRNWDKIRAWADSRVEEFTPS